MRELFEAIAHCEVGSSNIVLTLLTKEHLAEKALISNRKLVWESVRHGFFSTHKEMIEGIDESGIVEIDGSEVFCDTLGREKQLVICGGGHVSIPIIQMGIMLGFEIMVLEDRPQFADNARRVGATTVICDRFEVCLDKTKGSADTYFVIVTRGHRYDQVCLEKISKKEHAYIGMIGSKRRVTLVKQFLVAAGCDREVLNNVFTPIGLDIGAETPTEIAVAIMAEIISVKNKKKRTYGYSKEIIQAIEDVEKFSEQKVLATIINRKGSAPQGIGVKMLVFSDGRSIGTIGGGCMESNILRRAISMTRAGTPEAIICTVDLTGADAEDEGMVCGGVVEVLLEIIK